MLQRIVAIYKIKRKYDKLTDKASIILAATKKEPQCLYRPMNIVFSDRFSEGFAQFGNVADWAELDAGKVSLNQLFWEARSIQRSRQSIRQHALCR